MLTRPGKVYTSFLSSSKCVRVCVWSRRWLSLHYLITEVTESSSSVSNGRDSVANAASSAPELVMTLMWKLIPSALTFQQFQRRPVSLLSLQKVTAQACFYLVGWSRDAEKGFY